MLDKLMGAANSVTVTSTDGFMSRLFNSVIGVLIGLVLFLASFVILWWNEGNVIAEKGAFEEMRKVVQKAQVSAPAAKHNGKLVFASGPLKSVEKIGDAPYLKAGDFLVVERVVEMYQWTEKSETRRKSNLGGSSTRETTYTYALGWAPGRVESASFQMSAGHENPPLTVEGHRRMVKKSSLGKFDGAAILERVYPTENLPVTKENLASGKETKGAVINKGLLYFKKDPKATGDKIGDVRVSYRVVRQGPFSVMARQMPGGKLGLWKSKNGKEKFLVEEGKKQPKQMIEHGKEAASDMAWVFRFVGFAVMWIGLNLLAGPLITLLDFIPILATVGRFVLGAIFGLVAFVLSGVTMLVSMIAHSPVLLVLFLGAAIGGAVYYVRVVKPKKDAAAERAATSGAGNGRKGSKEPQPAMDDVAAA